MLFFMAFLATPTVVGMIDKETDTSFLYSVSEEEEHQSSFNIFESIQTSHISIFNFNFESISKLNFLVSIDLSFDNLAHQIFSPPPNYM